MTWTGKNLPTACTFSKDPAAWGLPQGVQVSEARGCKVKLSGAYGLTDRGWLVDWSSSLGANLIGQGGPFGEHLALQARNGVCFTLPHRLEAEVAYKLALLLGRNVPGWLPGGLGVRWCGTGTDAVAMAVRLARACVMSPEKVINQEEIPGMWILCFGEYHGWHDWTISRCFQPAYTFLYAGHAIFHLGTLPSWKAN